MLVLIGLGLIAAGVVFSSPPCHWIVWHGGTVLVIIGTIAILAEVLA